MLINNGDGTFHDENAQRLGFQEDSGNWLRYVTPTDLTGHCNLDLFMEFQGGANGNESRIYINDGTGHFTRLTTGLSDTFGIPHPIDVNGTGQKSFISTGGDGFYLVPVVSGSPCIDLASAVLPVSRSIQVGYTATAFATVLNPGITPAYDCGLGIAGMPVGKFVYQATDPITNAVVGRVNPVLDIPAGGAQTYVIAVTPTAIVEPQQVKLSVKCANHRPVPEIIGVNTLLLSASATPIPDIVALAATPANDGIVNVPGAAGAGAFAVATVNVGASGSITASADTGSATLPVNISLCQTDPATGQCISAIGSSVTTQINANATPTFGIFVQGTGNVPFDPATNRIFVRFKDGGGVTRGATSVAVRTQ